MINLLYLMAAVDQEDLVAEQELGLDVQVLEVQVFRVKETKAAIKEVNFIAAAVAAAQAAQV